MGGYPQCHRVERKSDARKLRALGRRGEMKHKQGQILDAKGNPDSEERHCKCLVSNYLCYSQGDRKLWAILFSQWQ